MVKVICSNVLFLCGMDAYVGSMLVLIVACLQIFCNRFLSPGRLILRCPIKLAFALSMPMKCYGMNGV